MHSGSWFHQKHLIRCKAVPVHSSGKPPWYFLIFLWIFPGIYIEFGAMKSPINSAINPAHLFLAALISCPRSERLSFPHFLPNNYFWFIILLVINIFRFSCGTTLQWSRDFCHSDTVQHSSSTEILSRIVWDNKYKFFKNLDLVSCSCIDFFF